MVNYLLRRLLFMVPTILGITFMVFMLLALAPGGIGAGLAVQGGQMSDTSKVAQMQAYLEDRYGLNVASIASPIFAPTRVRTTPSTVPIPICAS